MEQTMKLRELAEKLNLTVKGDGGLEIDRIKDTERLTSAESITANCIYYITAKKYLKKHPYLKNNSNAIILAPESLKDEFTHAAYGDDKTIHLKFIELLKLYEPEIPKPSHNELIHPKAKIGNDVNIYPGAVVMEGAVIHDHVTLYPGCVIESFAEIGEHSVIHPNAVIGHHCIVGKYNIIFGGTIIGADGFGYHDQDGKRYKIPQIGNVILEDYVEIGASSTVDRSTIESTIIGEDTKLDDQCHIGHNSTIGKKVYMAGNAGIAGSVTVEDEAMIGGACAISNKVTLAKGTLVMGLTGVVQDTEPKGAYFGIPARPLKKMHRVNSVIDKLPEMYDTLVKMAKEYEEKK